MHTITHVGNKPFENRAYCRCGFTTAWRKTRDDVEDEVLRHFENVQRARLGLGTRNPTLKSQRDYYREMSENEDVTPADRRLWLMLAEELDKRVKDKAGQTEQDGLFDMTPQAKKRSGLT